MGRVVMVLAVEGYGGLVQVEGVWRPRTIGEAVGVIDRLWSEQSSIRYWDCRRDSCLSFECRDKDRPDKILRVVWIPETRDDLEQLVHYVSKKEDDCV